MSRRLVAGIVGLVLLVMIGVAAPRVLLHGWLIAFAFLGGFPLGALALMMIHRLTGGRWGEAARPILVAATAALPLALLLVLPLLLGARLVYPWAADPSSAGSGVAAIILNPWSVGLRSLVGLGILCLFGRRLLAGRLGALGAGLGLCVYALFMNVASYDWLLSLDPRFTSSAFGAQIIVGQMLSALCLAAFLGRAPDEDPAWADLGALILATTLGESYLLLIGFSIDWYGDLPDQAHWYVSRTLGGWRWLEIAGALLGAVLPMLALLFGRVRRDPLLLRPVALAVLLGLLIEDIWLVAPTTEPVSALTGLLAVGTLALLLPGAAAPLSKLTGRTAHGV